MLFKMRLMPGTSQFSDFGCQLEGFAALIAVTHFAKALISVPESEKIVASEAIP
jgi:hypothetical protein